MTYRLIDDAAVRRLVPMSRVLEWLDYEPRIRQGDRLRGACMLAGCGGSELSFSIDLERNLWYCFRCQRGGNQLDLWRLVRDRLLYTAATELCGLAGHPVPHLSAPPSRGALPPDPSPPATA